MTYLTAKNVLLKDSPKVPLTAIAIEAATLIVVAGILVQIFA